MKRGSIPAFGCGRLFWPLVFCLTPFLSLAQNGRVELLRQNWEGTGFVLDGTLKKRTLSVNTPLGGDSLYGFQQYNNRTDGWQNVWAYRSSNGYYTGINGGGAQKFKLVRPASYNSDSSGNDYTGIAHTGGCDSIVTSVTTNFSGQNGAHIITGRNSGYNFHHAGYYTFPRCNPTYPTFGNTPNYECQPVDNISIGCENLNSNTLVGLYSPAIEAAQGFSDLQVEMWVKVEGLLNNDYGQLRYYASPTPLAAPILKDVPLSAPVDGVWIPLEYEVLGELQDGTQVPVAPNGSTQVGQLQGLKQWTKVRYRLPEAIAQNPYLRIALFWTNKDAMLSQGAHGSLPVFPGLIVDDIVVSGLRFATTALNRNRYCSGSRITVPFEVLDTYYSFNAEDSLAVVISDVNGNFAAQPVVIPGSEVRFNPTSTSGQNFQGSITFYLPQNLPLGQGYRVKVVGKRKSDGTLTYASPSPTIITIIDPASEVPTITPSGEIKVCEGESVTLNVNSPNPSSIIYWYRNDPDSLISQFGQSKSATVNEPGIYWVESRNDLTCDGSSNRVVVTYYERPKNIGLSLNSRSVCYLDTIYDLATIVSPDNNNTIVQGQGVSFNNATGKYEMNAYLAGVGRHAIFLTYTDVTNGGCKYQVVDSVDVLPSPVSELSLHDTLVLCYGGSQKLSTVIASPYVNPNIITGRNWYFNNTIIGSSTFITVSEAGIYYADVLSANCDARTDTLTVLVLPDEVGLKLHIEPDPVVQDNVVSGTYDPSLIPVPQAIDHLEVYVFVNNVRVADGVANPNGTFSVQLPTRLKGGEKVRVSGGLFTNPAVVDCDEIKVLPSQTVLIPAFADNIPTGFSPNGDGVNDYFVIPNIDNFPQNSLIIFNRWGSIVYPKQAYNSSKLWDGENVPDGQYYYVLELALPDGTTQKLKGSFTLIR